MPGQLQPLDLPLFNDPRTQTWAPLTPGRRLPHLHKPGCTAFVTFCLADAAFATQGRKHRHLPIPDHAPRPDRGQCLLADHENAAILEGALAFFNEDRYLLHAWCVMPNHVHILLTPDALHRVGDLVKTWKTHSAKAINRRLGVRGSVFQKDWFDHLVRSPDQAQRFIRYIENNPVEAGLCKIPTDWPFSSARHRPQPT